MPKTAEAPAILRPGLDSLAITRGFTLKLAQDIPDDKLATRACPGSNHAAYVLGHIASTDSFFLSALSGNKAAVPESWGALFAHNIELSDDRTAYPSKHEILEVMASTRAAIVEWLESLSVDQLRAPIEGDLAQFSATIAGLPSSLAFHEGFHAGQLSTVRRALNIPRLF